MKNIAGHIQKLASLSEKTIQPLPERVVFASSSAAVKSINSALSVMRGERNRLMLTKDLFGLWLAGGREAEEIFGTDFPKSDGKVLYTLTVDSRQLRVWHELPRIFSDNHVYGCAGILLGVYGSPLVVEKYRDVLQEVKRLRPVFLSNSVIVYVGDEAEKLVALLEERVCKRQISL